MKFVATFGALLYNPEEIAKNIMSDIGTTEEIEDPKVSYIDAAITKFAPGISLPMRGAIMNDAFIWSLENPNFPEPVLEALVHCLVCNNNVTTNNALQYDNSVLKEFSLRNNAEYPKNDNSTPVADDINLDDLSRAALDDALLGLAPGPLTDSMVELAARGYDIVRIGKELNFPQNTIYVEAIMAEAQQNLLNKRQVGLIRDVYIHQKNWIQILKEHKTQPGTYKDSQLFKELEDAEVKLKNYLEEA